MSFSSTSSSSNLSSLRQQQSSSNENQENIVKDILKCNYISLKLVKDNESTSSYQRFWGMFMVVNDQIPILELFTKEQNVQQVNNLESVIKINLKKCNHISIPILNSTNDQENNNEFVISLDNQLLQIYVDNKELLNEWVNCMRSKLASLNVFSPQDNIYSKEPIMNTAAKKPIARRPLPPLPDQEQDRSMNVSQLNRPMERLTTDQRYSNERNHLIDSNATTSTHHYSNHFNHPTTSSTNNYEHLATGINNGQFNTFSTTYQSSSLSSSSNQSNETSQILSLRESQVAKLQKEIASRAGVKLRAMKVDCYDSIAVIDWLGHVWVRLFIFDNY